MDDAFGMGGVESTGDLNSEFEQAREIERFSGDVVFESLAFEQFHGDEGTAFKFADIVDGANIGVIQGRGGARFTAKAFDGLRVLRNIVGQEFQGDVAAETRVFGFVDHAHATAAEFSEHVVVRNIAANHRGSVGHGTRSLTQRSVAGNQARAMSKAWRHRRKNRDPSP